MKNRLSDPIYFRTYPDTEDKLRKLAKEHCRSLSNIISYIVTEYVKEHTYYYNDKDGILREKK